MVSALLLLPFLCGIVIDEYDPDTCDLLVRVEEQDGRPAPPDLWVRAQFVGGASVAAPLEAGVAALRTRCGLHRVEVGSPAADPWEMASPRTEAWVHPLAEETAVTRLGKVTEVRLFLPPSAEMRLEALGPRDNPLAGFQLYARSADRLTGFSLITGKGGRARFRGKLGTYDLHWLHPDVRSVRVEGRESGSRVRLTEEGLTIAVRMDDVGPARGEIRTCHGKPLAGVEVQVEQPWTAFRETASTDGRGLFRKPLVRPPLTLRPQDALGTWTFVPAAISCETVPCHAAFTACPAESGCLRVLVVSDREGEQVAHAAFSASATCADGEPEFAVSGHTDVSGRALLPCPQRCPLTLRTVKHGWLERHDRLPPAACQDELVIRLGREEEPVAP